MNPVNPPTDKETRKQSLGWDGVSGGVAYRTEGVRLACLVNASVTVCGDDSIYAFGGFDQFTDEVFNHVLKLDLKTFTWKLVDNYGDIPSVRMGHTTAYWKDDKLISFGGEDERRVFLSDVYIFDLPTATWSQPIVSGHPPVGRSRHAMVLHDDKLFIHGGIHNSAAISPRDDEHEHNYREVLDDFCYLDLKTMTWSRTWRWVARFDHQAWIREGKFWIYGGMGKEMDRRGELVSLDIGHPAFQRTRLDHQPSGYKIRERGGGSAGASRVLRSHGRSNPNSPRSMPLCDQRRTTPPKPHPVPGSSNSITFISGKDVPSEAHGTHFHHMVGNNLLDFVTIANSIRPSDTGISSLDLNKMTWNKLANGIETLGGANWRWHYLAVAPNSTTAYLLGCPTDNEEISEGEDSEYLSDVLPIDLRTFGLNPGYSVAIGPSSGMLGADLASIFNSADSDFTIRSIRDEATEGDEYDLNGTWQRTLQTADNPNSDSTLPPEAALGPPIRCHKLILLSRWRHFTALYNSQMAEFHQGTLYLPEPYTVVKAFVYYLYTDSIVKSPHCPDVTTVAGLLVMANLYDIPRLRLLALERLYGEVDVENAAVIWERACVAGEETLRKKAAGVVLTYWGRVVRTQGFRRLSKRSLMELCEEVDEEGRVMGGEEVEAGGRETRDKVRENTGDDDGADMDQEVEDEDEDMM